MLLQVPKSDSASARIEESQRNFNLYKTTYEKLRDDVNVKLQFLDENRVRFYHEDNYYTIHTTGIEIHGTGLF